MYITASAMSLGWRHSTEPYIALAVSASNVLDKNSVSTRPGLMLCNEMCTNVVYKNSLKKTIYWIYK